MKHLLPGTHAVAVTIISAVAGLTLVLTASGQDQSLAPQATESKVFATSKTSTLEKELNEAADAGFRFAAVMGGETAIGGKEVVAVVTRNGAPRVGGRFLYKLLATSKTSTMEKELREAAEAGFEYRDQTVFESLFGGQEV